jgi:hypothetical protein
MSATPPTAHSGTFCQPWSCYASPYSGWQNVIYSRNVMRNAPYIGQKVFLKNNKILIEKGIHKNCKKYQKSIEKTSL